MREKIRTPDTLVRSQVLYPAELHTHKLAHKDSNLEMTESESVALPFGDGPILIINAEGGIRTLAPLRTNGFQDRLVMTTSIPLHISDPRQRKSYDIKR